MICLSHQIVERKIMSRASCNMYQISDDTIIRVLHSDVDDSLILNYTVSHPGIKTTNIVIEQIDKKSHFKYI